MVGALIDVPRRVGHPLQRELAGLWAARRGPYRVVYEIDDEAVAVTVLRIDHRADVYRRH
jgi:mRNA-degrading endonuclease RelE of RelBE toxin-antitoxin system